MWTNPFYEEAEGGASHLAWFAMRFAALTSSLGSALRTRRNDLLRLPVIVDELDDVEEANS